MLLASFHRIGRIPRCVTRITGFRPLVQGENSAPKGRKNRKNYFRGVKIQLDDGCGDPTTCKQPAYFSLNLALY